MDLFGALADEVALEGLDGITLSALWLRLSHRAPPFPLLLDKATKQLLWQSLVCNPELAFYQLPEKRRPLLLNDRYEEIERDPAVLKAKRGSTSIQDVYPVYIISDNKNSIQGSCQFFNERIPVTDQVRTQALQPCFTYEEAIKRWGEKLVIVASQVLRFRALIGWEGDPALELPDCSYCMLEKLGRSRWQGELQKDLQGSFKVDAGKIHYIRRALDKHGLITMQSHVVRLSNGTQLHSLLLLLKRFHADRRNKYDLLTEKVSALLSESQNQMETLVNLRKELCLCERIFKRLYYYMVNAGIAKILSVPLQDMQPFGGPCKTKKGTNIMIRCLKLIKEYKRKVEDSDDEDDEDIKTPIPPVDIIYEKDMLTQTYELIENRGTKGISQSEIRMAMNVGKLEARMLCRLLERYMLIKGFMEDEGRQRTTKFISHVFVEESDLRRQFEEEKAKSEKLSTFGNVSTWSVGQSKPASPGDRPSVEEEARLSETDDNEDLNGSKKLKTDSDSILKYLSAGVSHQSTLKVRSRVALPKDADKMSVLSENDCSLDSFQLETNISTLSTHSTDEDDGDVSVIEEIIDKASEKKETKKRSRPGVLERSRETYRLLKRRNIIIEAVKNLKLVESLFMLQKMIVEQEKQEGVSTKCCKKSILRLVHKLSQEGLVRLYRTTVIQDGISKKVELVVHPSINPSDPLVKSAIEQIRFRISNSTAGNRTKSSHGPLSPSKLETGDHSKGKTKESQNTSPSQNGSAKKVLKKTDEKMGVTELKNYHPVTVPGLGRTLGYLPKMPRLKITHIFFWYIVYGHHGAPQQQISHKKTPFGDITREEHEKTEQMSTENIPDPENAETGPSNQCNNSEESLWEPEADRIMATVYVDDDSWKRFVPPVPIHEEFGHGWTLIGDILLCMPLSIFVQIVQVSYKVENLEDFLNHPIKKHTLIRYLPRPIRQQLLYKRRYIFSVFTSLQKLSCMGLVQFGPSERFQDRDQIFVYLKKKATIVDTTACDPHYNLAQGSHPFEKRFYNLITFQDVENFWFDLHFVCLNTPLGVVRFPRLKKANPEADDEHLPGQDLDLDQENKRNLERRCGILECTTGSREVVDDGSVPGDGMGAGGLDYSFYSHLKRNWVWISYIINKAKKSKAAQDSGLTRRLQTFLNKHPLPLCSGGSPKSVFGDVNLTETGELIQIAKEATENRNKRVCGGKGQKRKRPKKDAGKKAKKNKGKNNEQDKNRKCRYHDQADQSALQRMTRLRVTWSAQEDGLVMLCRIASNILNKKVKRPFVPWQVVRDILHYSLDESLDKTSHSVGRRARYFMKNPQTYLNYKVSLAEVYQDKCLVDDFMSRKQNYEDPKVCAGEFKEFVESLRQKFSTSLCRPASEIPDTVHELFDRYRVLAIGDESNQGGPIEFLNSVDDIHLLVLQNLILSTLALSDMQMKNYRSFQTFRIYREYKEEILVKAFLEFQNKRLVNRRRGNHTLGPKKSRALPFVPMSYHLSQTYYRFFTWRFPATICSESFEFLETLKAFGDADQADTFSFSDQENEAAADMMIFPLDGPGGQCVTILSMFLLGLVSVNVKIPDQIVVVDSNLVENEVIKSFGREGLDDEDYDDEEMDDTLGNKQKIEVKARQASHTNYLLMRGYCAPGIVSTRNLNPNDNVVVNACIVRVKLRCTPVQGRFKASGSVDDVVAGVSCLPHNFTQLLNFKDCSFSTFLTQCTETLGYSSADVSCVTEVQSAVEACSCFGIKMSDLGEKFIPYEELDAERTRCLQHYIQDLLTYEQVLRVGGISVRLVAMKHANPWLLHPESVKEQMTQSRAHFIKEAESEESAQQSAYNQTADVDNGGSDTPSTKALLEDEDPLSPTDMDKPKLSLMKENETTEEHIFAQTMHAGDGQNVPTDINKADTETTDAQQHAKELNDVVSCTEEKTDNTDTFKGDSAGTLPERESELYFLGRPWRVIDGSLNKPVCKGMMEAVLYHIMTKPGITKTSVLQYYSGVLQPVIVMELLQVLEHVGCIKKRYIETSSKVSLFSRTVIAEEIKNPKLCEDPTAFYEPTLDCTLRLGRMFPSEINWNNCPP